MEISFSFGLGLCKKITQTFELLGFESKTPIDVKEIWNHQIMWFYKELVDLR